MLQSEARAWDELYLMLGSFWNDSGSKLTSSLRDRSVRSVSAKNGVLYEIRVCESLSESKSLLICVLYHK